jgi:UDP:flavonoid glycosyltransferase YjiC (YdhE family)
LRPAPELVDFLADGPPPVLVTAGSFGNDDVGRLPQLFVESVRRAGVRCVIQTSWGGLSDDRTIAIGDVDYQWLLPQMAAVVHHGGAGTTASTLLAGVPAVPVPMFFDNFFWARRLVAVGVSPGRTSVRTVTVDRLTQLVRRAVHDGSFRERAAAVSARIAGEDGAGRLVAEIDALAFGYQATGSDDSP